MNISIEERNNLVQLGIEYEGHFDFIEASDEQNFNDLLISVLCDQLEADFDYSNGNGSVCSISFEKNDLKGSSASQVTELLV